MTIFPSISPISLFGLGALSPVSAPLATTQSSLSFLGGGSTIVELSGLGQLLSAVATFQNRLAVLQPGSTDSGIGRNFGTDFGSLAAEAQSFVDTFNGLQGSVNGLSGIFGGFATSSSVTQLARDLNERIASVFDNGDSSLTTLSDLGIEFQPSPFPGFVGSPSIDMTAMKAAFDADPEGSFALLARAVDAFEKLAADVTGPANGISSILATQMQISATQLSLNLFGDQSDGSRSGLQGMTDLFALASLGEGRNETQARLLIAMNEFSLVSSLLS
ncbi:hypothetical protein [Aromatoleum diolicum]|uniref:Uncharacterized protein n=1 Tax=Aromatoleum diolicum TaxID=75796 RepID=A0ABX1Q9F9_9RHOO|nr:hypothetical protein [Aromatoleum diolicum]NMG74943.1 hypothetical protein [Aromatoleum diolicum]